MEVAFGMHQRGDEQVAEVVSFEAETGFEPVGEGALHQRLGLGERDEALASVSGRRDVELRAESPGAPAVVRHGDDSCDVVGVLLQAAQCCGEAGAAADGDDAQTAAAGAMPGEAVDDAPPSLRVPGSLGDAPVEHDRGANDHEHPDAAEARATGNRPERAGEVDSSANTGNPCSLAELKEGCRYAQRDNQHPGDAEEEPALQPDAGPQQQQERCGERHCSGVSVGALDQVAQPSRTNLSRQGRGSSVPVGVRAGCRRGWRAGDGLLGSLQIAP